MTTVHIADERSLKQGYDAVLTLDDYHDGPCRGVANFRGEPHYFERIFDDALDEYSDCYRLTRLSPQALQAAKENWEIFRRWRAAFDSGKTDLSTHPALPEERDRFKAMQRQLEEALAKGRARAIRTRGEFVAAGDSPSPVGVLSPWQVRWSDS